jgi:hypothetical protein
VGNAKSVKALVEAFPTIDPNIKDRDGKTALMRAIETESIEAVKALLVNFKDIELPKDLPSETNPEWRSWLEAYAEEPVEWLIHNQADAETIVEYILSKNIKLNYAQKEELIKLAAEEGKPELIQQLIAQAPKEINDSAAPIDEGINPAPKTSNAASYTTSFVAKEAARNQGSKEQSL